MFPAYKTCSLKYIDALMIVTDISFTEIIYIIFYTKI